MKKFEYEWFYVNPETNEVEIPDNAIIIGENIANKYDKHGMLDECRRVIVTLIPRSERVNEI